MRWLDILAEFLYAVSGRVRRWRYRKQIKEGNALFNRVHRKE